MHPKAKQSKSGAKQEEPESEDILGEEEIDEEFDEEVRPKGVAVGGAGIRREAEEVIESHTMWEELGWVELESLERWWKL